jgi:glycogen debranching enzyme
VQAYAYRAALDGADLLDAFDRPGTDRYRQWGHDLAARFAAAFLISDAFGEYPAVGLDRDKRPIDGPASNMGHVLGSGLLEPTVEAAVADRLTGPAFLSRYGIRTLAQTAVGFNPLGYHTGSVWPHDNAIIALGMVRAGLPRHAATVVEHILNAAEQFGYRLPELFGGGSEHPLAPVVPYPAACCPQAWSAASGPALARILLGLRPDIPGGVIHLAPVVTPSLGSYSIRNVRLGAGTLGVDVTAAGEVTVVQSPPGVTVTRSAPDRREASA